MLSGTSQACPHAAGVAALVLSLLPKATPSEVGAVTMTMAAFMILLSVFVVHSSWCLIITAITR